MDAKPTQTEKADRELTDAELASVRGGQPQGRETVRRRICHRVDMQFVTKEQLEQMVDLEMNFPGVEMISVL